jgi:hypothetical protein
MTLLLCETEDNAVLINRPITVAARSKAGYRLRAQLFVRAKHVRLFTVFVSSIEARQPLAATRISQLKEHSTLKSLCRGTKNRSDLARDAPSSRAATCYRLYEAKQRTLPRAADARNRYPA